jgi:hypothetical protein
MTDPREPEARQPYHAVQGRPIDEATRRIHAYAEAAALMAGAAMRRIVGQLAGSGLRVIGVGILESAGRRAGSFADILRSHATIHTADGDHFRSALAAGAAGCGLSVWRVRARDLEVDAANAIGQAHQTLQQTVKELGREAGPPCGADQKAAALLAWLVLARHSRSPAEGGDRR